MQNNIKFFWEMLCLFVGVQIPVITTSNDVVALLVIPEVRG